MFDCSPQVNLPLQVLSADDEFFFKVFFSFFPAIISAFWNGDSVRLTLGFSSGGLRMYSGRLKNVIGPWFLR